MAWTVGPLQRQLIFPDEPSPRDLHDTSDDTVGIPHDNHSLDEMVVCAPDAEPEENVSVDMYQDPPGSLPTTPSRTLELDISTKVNRTCIAWEG